MEPKNRAILVSLLEYLGCPKRFFFLTGSSYRRLFHLFHFKMTLKTESDLILWSLYKYDEVFIIL